MIYRSMFWLNGTMLAVALLWAGPGADKDGDAEVRKQFESRISEYLKLRKAAIEKIARLNPKSTPEQIQAHKSALIKAIGSARRDAHPGAMFTARIRDHFIGIIRSEMRGKEGWAAKAASEQGNPTNEGPPVPVAIKVNAAYPDTAPLSSVPSTLLLRLPQLPKELEYRFVGRNLILRDSGASLIVDYLLDAVP